MSSLSQSRGTVLVTDAGRGSAINIIRSLGRQGWRVIAGDSSAQCIGFRSKHVAESLVYPSPDSAPHEFIDLLFESVEKYGIDLIIPVTDEIIHPLTQSRTRFEKKCQLALPDTEALEVVTNKDKTLELAEELGVPTPKTRLVHTASEARVAAQEMSWPIVLKPKVSRNYIPEQGVIESCSVSYANDMQSLTSQMRQFEGRCAVLLQAYCHGSGLGVELLAHEGQMLAAFQHGRLAEIPISGGASAWRESMALDPQLYDYASRLVKALNWTGLMMVEFKVGETTTLMEINGRVWGSLPLAVLSGMDFPAKLAELYFSGPPKDNSVLPDTNYTVGMRAYNLELILMWIPQVLFEKRRYSFLPLPKRRQAVAPLVGLLTSKSRFDILSWRDPKPGLAEIVKIVRKFSGKLKDRVQTTKAHDGQKIAEPRHT